MASFKKYETKDGIRWLFQVCLGRDPQTGKYKYTTRRGFKTKKEAEKAVRELLNEVEEVGFTKNEYLTFEEIFKEWIEKEKKRLKPSSIENKISKFEKRILPHFRKLYIKDISTEYCQKFIDNLSKEIISFRDYGIQLNLLFKYAKNHGYISNNPMNRIVYPITEKEHLADYKDNKVEFWDRDTVNTFLRRCENELSFRNYAMFRLFLYTGIRKGELAALEEKDVLIETKEINIYKNLYWRNGKYYLLKPKTVNAIRTISLDEKTFSVLLRLIELNAELRKEWGNPQIEHFLFPRDDLRPMRLAYPNEILESACKKFKIKNIKVHGLRHTHASMLFAAGARMKDVQKRLGHSQISTTMDIYTHITKQSEKNLSNLLADYIESCENTHENFNDNNED